MIKLHRAKLLCAVLGCALLLSAAPVMSATARGWLGAGTQVSGRAGAAGPSLYRMETVNRPAGTGVDAYQSRAIHARTALPPTLNASLSVTATAAFLGATDLTLGLTDSSVYLPLVIR